MHIFRTTEALQEWRSKLEGPLAFVPTMGALHAGHASLMAAALCHAPHCLASVFVNPTQFDNAGDLANYPSTLDADISLLDKVGCSAVFAPIAEEIYPPSHVAHSIDLGGLAEVMEGTHRAGHFEGVVEVVSRLFDIVRPDMACFGEKDFQQLAIIRRMTALRDDDIQIMPCPIIREKHGLAMSSRNERLSEDDREYAGILYRTLMEMKEMAQWLNPDEVANWGRTHLQGEARIELEYVEVAGSEDLQAIFRWQESNEARGFIAAHIGGVRLIDNMVMKP